jgi:hypothetical protein
MHAAVAIEYEGVKFGSFTAFSSYYGLNNGYLSRLMREGCTPEGVLKRFRENPRWVPKYKPVKLVDGIVQTNFKKDRPSKKPECGEKMGEEKPVWNPDIEERRIVAWKDGGKMIEFHDEYEASDKLGIYVHDIDDALRFGIPISGYFFDEKI